MTDAFRYTPVSESGSETTLWRVKTYHKKCCQQIEYFTHPDYSDPLIVSDGFRWCEYYVETDDGEPPNFEFTYVPDGDGNKDSIDLNNCCHNNIVSSELIQLIDGGCFGGPEWPQDMDQDTQNELQDFVDENGYLALEHGKGWNLTETEVWVWGPIEICDSDDNSIKIIIADQDGNISEFQE